MVLTFVYESKLLISFQTLVYWAVNLQQLLWPVTPDWRLLMASLYKILPSTNGLLDNSFICSTSGPTSHTLFNNSINTRVIPLIFTIMQLFECFNISSLLQPRVYSFIAILPCNLKPSHTQIWQLVLKRANL